jgi:hypothetical protein
MQEIVMIYQGRQKDILELQERISDMELKHMNKLHQKENERPGSFENTEGLEDVSTRLEIAEQRLVQQQLHYEQSYAGWKQTQASLEQELRQARLGPSNHDGSGSDKAEANIESKLREQVDKKDKIVRALGEAVKQLGAVAAISWYLYAQKVQVTPLLTVTTEPHRAFVPGPAHAVQKLS